MVNPQLVESFLFTFNPHNKIYMNYEALVNDEAEKLIQKLVSDIRNKKAVDVRFEFVNNDQWSVVSIYMDEQDDELALRLHAGDNYELYVGYYDEEDELREVTKMISDEEKKGIPKGLQKVMGKVLSDEEGLRVPGSLLSM